LAFAEVFKEKELLLLIHSPLIEKYLTQLQGLALSKQYPVLDLACGSGRNGLYLIANDIPVTFADINSEALGRVKHSLSNLTAEQQKLAQCWQVDFEQAGLAQKDTEPFQDKAFSAVLVFRYLYRPLFEQIKATIKPGGMVIYETFTEQQAQFGRPKNPDFLLKSGELLELFSDWQILHSFEGVVNAPADNDTQQAIAQIVAIKPGGLLS